MTCSWPVGGIVSDAGDRGTIGRSDDFKHPALRAHRHVAQPVRLSPRDQFYQRPGGAVEEPAKIALREPTETWELYSDFARHPKQHGTGIHQISFEMRKQIGQRLLTAWQQAVQMPGLWHPGPR